MQKHHRYSDTHIAAILYNKKPNRPVSYQEQTKTALKTEIKFPEDLSIPERIKNDIIIKNNESFADKQFDLLRKYYKLIHEVEFFINENTKISYDDIEKVQQILENTKNLIKELENIFHLDHVPFIQQIINYKKDLNDILIKFNEYETEEMKFKNSLEKLLSSGITIPSIVMDQIMKHKDLVYIKEQIKIIEFINEHDLLEDNKFKYFQSVEDLLKFKAECLVKYKFTKNLMHWEENDSIKNIQKKLLNILETLEHQQKILQLIEDGNELIDDSYQTKYINADQIIKIQDKLLLIREKICELSSNDILSFQLQTLITNLMIGLGPALNVLSFLTYVFKLETNTQKLMEEVQTYNGDINEAAEELKQKLKQYIKKANACKNRFNENSIFFSKTETIIENLKKTEIEFNEKNKKLQECSIEKQEIEIGELIKEAHEFWSKSQEEFNNLLHKLTEKELIIEDLSKRDKNFDATELINDIKKSIKLLNDRELLLDLD